VGDSRGDGCNCEGALAVVNFDGFLLGANHSQLPRGWAGDKDSGRSS